VHAGQVRRPVDDRGRAAAVGQRRAAPFPLQPLLEGEALLHTSYPDLERAVREVKGGRVEFKVDKSAIIHVPVGKSSFEATAIVDNLAALVDAINRAKPAGAKGQYLRSLTVASTMGPGIRVDVPAVLAAAVA
jgi:hypothetical protein